MPLRLAALMKSISFVPNVRGRLHPESDEAASGGSGSNVGGGSALWGREETVLAQSELDLIYRGLKRLYLFLDTRPVAVLELSV